MYPVQIPGNSFRDNYNRAWLQSLTPPVFSLWARSGKFGIPMSGSPLTADGVVAAASLLAAGGEKVTFADMTGMEPFAYIQNLVAGGYTVFSYVGEPNPDWATMPPGQTDPAGKIPPYNAEGHTGVVSFALLLPYVGPVPAPTLYVGQRANAEGMYNAINGAEKVFVVGQDIVEGGIRYVFIGFILGVAYWQIVGRA